MVAILWHLITLRFFLGVSLFWPVSVFYFQRYEIFLGHYKRQNFQRTLYTEIVQNRTHVRLTNWPLFLMYNSKMLKYTGCSILINNVEYCPEKNGTPFYII